MSISKRSLNEPLAFTPFYRPQVWGGRRLAELLGKSLPAGLSIGGDLRREMETLQQLGSEHGLSSVNFVNDKLEQ